MSDLLTSILGAPEASKEQAAYWVIRKAARGQPAYDDPQLCALVDAYWRIGEEEGVRPDVALAQAVKETGAFTFDGSVRPEQYNFAGIGATGGGVPGESWPTVDDGVRGHLRRLRMYAEGSDAIYDLDILKRPLPRPYWRSAPNVEDLGGKWATSPGYGVSIVQDYLAPMLATTAEGETPTRPFNELRDTGLLWALNRYVLHGRGFAAALVFEDDDLSTAIGWQLLGDGSKPWSFDRDADAEGQRKFRDFLWGDD